jgi:hypothetical protein
MLRRSHQKVSGELLSFVPSSSGDRATQVPLSKAVFYTRIDGRLQAAVLPPSGGLELSSAVDFAIGY